MDASTPKDAKIRVDKATAGLTKTRCLITNVECDRMVDYAHVLACAIENDEYEMDKLEYSWDMVWRTQNIHTRRNIFRLSAKFHRLFDANKWLLLPETSIIDQYKGAIQSKIFPAIKKKVYKYKLIAHPDMEQVPIHRRNNGLPTSAGAFEKFVYPFEEFPDIVSHVHPRFVIYNAGSKLAHIREIIAFAKGMAGELYDTLIKVVDIYKAWEAAIPEKQFYQDENEVKAQSGHIKLDREGTADVCYAESSASSTPPTLRKRHLPSQSVVNGTPSERVLDHYPITDKAKARVDSVAAKRCLIENTDKANIVDYAHLVPRSTNDVILTALEYSWRMPHNTFNVDTRRNIFRLSRNFHRLFDGNAWLLLPEKTIIDQYYEVKDNSRKFPVFDSLTYRYTLIVNNFMEHVPIHAQGNKPSSVSEDGGDMDDDEESVKEEEESCDNIDFNLEDAFTAHTYPFPHFPLVVSHVHPRFVIWNAGAKMAAADAAGAFIATNPLEAGNMLKVLDIYEAWNTKRLPSDFVNAGILPQDKPAGDFPDNQTDPGRIPPPAKRPRPPHVPGDGSPKSGKRAKSGGGKDSAWLDDATLAELEPDRSPKKAWQEKVEWIQTWVGQVPLDAMEETPIKIDVADKSVCHTPDLDWEEINSVLSA